MCYSNVELAAINPRLPLQGVSSVAQSAVDQALCIQVTNFAFPVWLGFIYFILRSLMKSAVLSSVLIHGSISFFKGEYFTDIAVQPSTVFGTPRGKKNPSYVDSNTYNVRSSKFAYAYSLCFLMLSLFWGCSAFIGQIFWSKRYHCWITSKSYWRHGHRRTLGMALTPHRFLWWLQWQQLRPFRGRLAGC